MVQKFILLFCAGGERRDVLRCGYGRSPIPRFPLRLLVRPGLLSGKAQAPPSHETLSPFTGSDGAAVAQAASDRQAEARLDEAEARLGDMGRCCCGWQRLPGSAASARFQSATSSVEPSRACSSR
jgi:hypothetical protein